MICYNCGKSFEGTYYKHHFKKTNSAETICEDCFHSLYWKEVLENPNTIIVYGLAYCMDDSGDGKKFRVCLKKDGSIRETGLWFNGKVPEEYKVEDTAVFLQR